MDTFIYILLYSLDTFHPLLLVKNAFFWELNVTFQWTQDYSFENTSLYCSCYFKCLSYRQYNTMANKVLTSFPIFEILQLEVHVQQTDRYIQRRTQRTWMSCHSWKRWGKKRLKQPENSLFLFIFCSTNLTFYCINYTKSTFIYQVT